MPNPHPGQLERALERVTIGMEQAQKRRRRQVVDGGGHEMEQQIRIPISGVASNGWAFAKVEVGFLYPFLWIPLQRSAPFSTPHFSYGVDAEGNENIITHVSVLKWNIDPSSHVLGATVQIGVSAPNYDGAPEDGPPYKMTLHLRFQGYGAETQEGEVA